MHVVTEPRGKRGFGAIGRVRGIAFRTRRITHWLGTIKRTGPPPHFPQGFLSIRHREYIYPSSSMNIVTLSPLDGYSPVEVVPSRSSSVTLQYQATVPVSFVLGHLFVVSTPALRGEPTSNKQNTSSRVLGVSRSLLSNPPCLPQSWRNPIKLRCTMRGNKHRPRTRSCGRD